MPNELSKTDRNRFRAACALLVLAVTAGCSLPLPQAQNDPTRTYVLSVGPSVAAAQPAANAPTVRLRPVELATYLRARPMIVRRGPNEIEFRDYARWGEPLEQGIARVLREQLLATGAARSVDSGGLRPADAGDAAFEVGVRVLACEGSRDGAINFHAVWEISPLGGDTGKSVRGEYRPTNLTWKAGNEATLAAGISQAVSGLAADLAAALAK